MAEFRLPPDPFSLATSPASGTLAQMKPWLLALLVIAACGLTLTWLIRQKVIPAFLASANEEIVADWHAALTECRAETGVWPDPADPAKFGELVFIVPGADGRRIAGGYMHGRASNYHGGIAYDAYSQPLRISVADEKLTVASAGPNRQWGDADDITSALARDRYTTTTLDSARAEAAARTASKKP